MRKTNSQRNMQGSQGRKHARLSGRKTKNPAQYGRRQTLEQDRKRDSLDRKEAGLPRKGSRTRLSGGEGRKK